MAYAKVPTRRISVYHLRGYLAAEKERGICENTLEGYRQIFSAYFNWLQRESLIERNPCTNLGVIKVPKKEKKTYSEIDLEKLVRGCKTKRDRAIIHFLASTGWRISEMTGLDRDAIKTDFPEIDFNSYAKESRVFRVSEKKQRSA
jgi:site-specific recombinase XerD